MFTEKLDRKDLENYAENVICGPAYEVSSPITCEKIYDKTGKLDRIDLSFTAVGSLTDDENLVNTSISDFKTNDDHVRFFVNKFGLSYVFAYKKYLKTLDISQNEKKILQQRCIAQMSLNLVTLAKLKLTTFRDN